MKIRAIALALPLVVWVAACKTSSSQSSGTASSGTQSDQASADSQSRGAAGPAAAGEASASGTATATPGTDPLMVPGEPVKAHGEDEVVSGKISKVSSSSVTITSDMGDEKTLSVVPETTVTVDGTDADAADLEEGQPVRASFSEVEGRDVAVEIRAGAGASGTSGSGSTGTGTPAETTTPGMGWPEPSTGSEHPHQAPDDPTQSERRR